MDKKSKSRLIAYFCLALAACFMVCIFAPLETYMNNILEFWYGYKEIVSVCALVFAVCFALAWIPFLLLRKTKLFGYLYTLCFCAFIGFYIQGNYIPRPYGIFDGREIDWTSSEYHLLALASILIIVGVILGTLLCCKFLRGRIYKVASFVCAVIMISQMSTLGVLYVKNGSLNTKSSETVITEYKQFDLNQDRNVIALMFDTFDGTIMTNLLAEGEYGQQLKKDLTGFTFYPDTVGAYTLTRASIPYILTGEWYTNDMPIEEHTQKAYQENPGLLGALREEGYSAGMYVYSTAYISAEKDAYVNVMEGHYVIKDYVDFIKNTYKMVVFNYVPHQMKKHFVMDYENINKTRAPYNNIGVYEDGVTNFYRAFEKKGRFSVDEAAPVFKFYYTTGVHQSYTFNEHLEDGDGFGLYDEAKGCMTLLRELIADLKSKGIYDNTAIVVLADHSDGWRSARGSNPLLMVKNFSDAGELVVSDLAVSYEDLEETFCSIIKEEILPGSVWSDDIKERTERKFMWYQAGGTPSDAAYLPVIRECVVKGKAWDPDAIRITGMLYDAGHAYYDPDYYKYELGEVLNLRSNGKHFEYGIESNGVSRDTASQMCFDIENSEADLSLTVHYHEYFSGVAQRVLLFANGTALGEIKSGEPVRISRSLIEDDGMLRLRFEYPDASTEAAQGLLMRTYLRAISFEDLVIEQAK